MFHHCIFCQSNLGRNQVLEHFQTGRRLAYDRSTGRLWVVCPRCERWNLSPLEIRWEAIEEAERAYGLARLRASTENVALAQLNEGLELVRIGRPSPLEFASWRYGDQLRPRRRRYLILLGFGAVVPFLSLLGPLGWAVGLSGSAIVLTHAAWIVRSTRRDMHVPTLFLKPEPGLVLPLTKHDTWSATLVTNSSTDDWHLTVSHRHGYRGKPRWYGAPAPRAPEPTTLRGAAARRALGVLLPYANPAGAGTRQIHEGVAFIASTSDLDRLIHQAATTKTASYAARGENPLTKLPAPIRVGLEIAVHEEDERRALEGGMHVLERRWREADEIARISDSLLVPLELEERLERLRQEAR